MMHMTQTMPDTRTFDSLARRAPATDDLLELADWLAAHGAAHLSAIERIELADWLISRRRFLIGAGVLAVGAITGCGPGEQAVGPTATVGTTADGFPRIVDHASGSIRLENPPSRVVCLEGMRTLDYLLSIGITPIASSVGGIGTFATALLDRTAGIEELAQGSEVSLEQVALLQPDFIVGFQWSFGEALNELQQIAPCFLFGGEDGQKWDENTRLIARCFAREEEAEAAINAVYDRVTAIGERIDGPVTISVIYPKPDGSFFLMQTDYVVAELLAPAGIVVTAPEGVEAEGSSLLDLSAELLGDVPGEYLFVLPLLDAEGVIEQNPLWSTLDAVAAGRIIRGDVTTWGNFGPIGLQVLLDDVERALL